ncbi:hypothetical protein BKA70DRAFT_298446 [Coprinopsis sp. MPI-PUGE-AT-0042]|nr:hypothetical protein BKA70DRAFT_298446 [Coprinopsis sp. MPI-PUGE-AT-0042]
MMTSMNEPVPGSVFLLLSPLPSLPSSTECARNGDRALWGLFMHLWREHGGSMSYSAAWAAPCGAVVRAKSCQGNTRTVLASFAREEEACDEDKKCRSIRKQLGRLKLGSLRGHGVSTIRRCWKGYGVRPTSMF